MELFHKRALAIAALIGFIGFVGRGLIAASDFGDDTPPESVGLPCGNCGFETNFSMKEIHRLAAERLRAQRLAAWRRKQEEDAYARARVAASEEARARKDNGLITPQLTTRSEGLIVSHGETCIFATDVLVIAPAPGTHPRAIMQYKIADYQGRTHPTQEWQNAGVEIWDGEKQFCFKLPTGRMNVFVRCFLPATGDVSEESISKGFLVQASCS
jgi:hypothetical protein